jgi:hypothetical protein
MQAHLAEILKNDGAETSDEPYKNIIGYPFPCRGNAGTSDLQDGLVKPPLLQRNCLLF